MEVGKDTKAESLSVETQVGKQQRQNENQTAATPREDGLFIAEQQKASGGMNEVD